MKSSMSISGLQSSSTRCSPPVYYLACALGLCLAFFRPPGARAEIAPDARPVIEHLVRALGGRPAFDGIRTVHSRGSVTTMGLSGTQESWRSAPDRGRENTVLGPYHISGGVDGPKGWRIGPDGKLAMLNGADLEDARSGVYFDNWVWLAGDQGGGRITLTGPRRDSTGSYVVLEVTPPAGKSRSLWFDATTGLLARMVETGHQPVVTTDFSEYRVFDGVRFPTKSIVHVTGMPANTIVGTIDSMWINPPIPAETFAAPADRKSSLRWLKTPGRADLAFRYDLHLIWVRASIEGAPPADFLFDTGASATVVDSGYAAKIGLATEGDGQIQGAGGAGHVALAKLGSLRVGDEDGVELGARTVAVIPVSAALGPALWRDFAGILGSDVIREFVVTVDYERQRLTLADPAEFRYEGAGAKLDFTLVGGVPVVPMKLDDRIDGNFRLDLGGSGGVVLQSAFAAAHGFRAAHAVSAAGSGFGGHYPIRSFRTKSLELGPLRWEDPIVTVADAGAGVLADRSFAGLIGNQVLERFRCTFDYAHDVVYLEPSGRASEPDPFTRVGVMLARDAGLAHATQVLAGSPAERAGLRVGDTVRTIDGQPVATWNADDLRRRFEATGDRSAVVFGIRRDGKDRIIIVHKKTLL